MFTYHMHIWHVYDKYMILYTSHIPNDMYMMCYKWNMPNLYTILCICLWCHTINCWFTSLSSFMMCMFVYILCCSYVLLSDGHVHSANVMQVFVVGCNECISARVVVTIMGETYMCMWCIVWCVIGQVWHMCNNHTTLYVSVVCV